MQLPTKKSGISKNWNDQKFVMLGAGGIGKSEFWSHCKNAIYIEAEPGLNFIEAFKIPCRNWNDVGKAMQLLVEAGNDPKNFPYGVVIVDTMDKVLDYVNESTLAWGRNKYSSADIVGIGDIPNGAGWDMRRAMIHKLLNALEKLPCAVVIISHIECKKIQEDGQKDFDKYTISIGGKLGGDILHWGDHTLLIKGNMLGDKLRRTVYTKPTKSREGKSRGGVIKDGWVWSENSKENFEQLRKQFT